MTDVSDVETVLVALIAQALYPDGTAAASLTGHRVKVFRGWPVPATLDADLKAGVVSVSVFPADAEKNVTRFADDWVEQPVPAIRTTVTLTATTVTLGGAVCCPLNASVVVNGKAFVYPLQATDTLTSVATALAALVNATFPATSNGPVVTVPGAARLEAHLGTVGTLVRELKRQQKSFWITVWCDSPPARDAVSSALDAALAQLTDISLPDGATGRIRYQRTRTTDASQKSLLYRRDLVYSVEYPTTATRRAAVIVAEQATVTTN